VCRFGSGCDKQHVAAHAACHIHLALPACLAGAGCAQFFDGAHWHRESFSHGAGVPEVLIPCREGAACPRARDRDEVLIPCREGAACPRARDRDYAKVCKH
jgi:hypothetical protein